MLLDGANRSDNRFQTRNGHNGVPKWFSCVARHKIERRKKPHNGQLSSDFLHARVESVPAEHRFVAAALCRRKSTHDDFAKRVSAESFGPYYCRHRRNAFTRENGTKFQAARACIDHVMSRAYNCFSNNFTFQQDNEAKRTV